MNGAVDERALVGGGHELAGAVNHRCDRVLSADQFDEKRVSHTDAAARLGRDDENDTVDAGIGQPPIVMKLHRLVRPISLFRPVSRHDVCIASNFPNIWSRGVSNSATEHDLSHAISVSTSLAKLRTSLYRCNPESTNHGRRKPPAVQQPHPLQRSSSAR